MHRPRDVSQCKTRLGHASTMRCGSVRPCLGHGIVIVATEGSGKVEDHHHTIDLILLLLKM
ncbi:hypothetical protein F383_14169 [Gossypium arboreum]|uniref:Uncharacterized protein n=1 Tax=Gossypium arboreum TaxID=29729 RepID=A0A0B0PZK8_GOSAR|nr:hypothetical protein F383_14169 [Gossypium arboreum]